jgi:hypothetical protein
MVDCCGLGNGCTCDGCEILRCGVGCRPSGVRLNQFPESQTIGNAQQFVLADDSLISYATLLESIISKMPVVPYGEYLSFVGIGAGTTNPITRDGYFSDDGNLDLLYPGKIIQVNENETVFYYIWTDEASPVLTYNPDKWTQAPIAVPPGTIEMGTLLIKEAGEHLALESKLANSNSMVLDRELDDELGSLDPISEKLSPLGLIETLGSTGIDIPIINGQQFTGSSSPGIDAYEIELQVIAREDFVNFYMIGRLEDSDITFVSDTINHTIEDKINGDLVSITLKNLAKIDESQTYVTTLYMDQPTVIVGGIVEAGNTQKSMLYDSEEIVPFQNIIGYNVLERQSLLQIEDLSQHNIQELKNVPDLEASKFLVVSDDGQSIVYKSSDPGGDEIAVDNNGESLGKAKTLNFADGLDAVMESDTVTITPRSVMTPEQVRDDLQSLEGDERLDYSAVKNNNALTTHYTSEDLTVPANWNGDVLTVIDATGDITVTLPSVDLLLNAWSLLIVNTASTQTNKVTVLAGDGTYIINDDDCRIPSQASIKLGYNAVYNVIYPIHFEGFPKYITINAGGGNLGTSWSIEGYVDFDANYSQIYAVKMSFTLSAVVANITTDIRLVGIGESGNQIYFSGSKASNTNGYHEIDLIRDTALPDRFMTFELQARRSPVWGQSSVGKVTIIYGDKP